MTRVTEFQEKDVVNVADGKKLGNIGDIIVNLNTGKIESIIIAKNNRVLGFFGKDEEIIITWNNIVKIGEDVILVRYSQVASDIEKTEIIPY